MYIWFLFIYLFIFFCCFLSSKPEEASNILLLTPPFWILNLCYVVVSTCAVLQKEKKPTRSMVWRLGGDKLSKKCIATFGCQRVFPYIFPWKRAVNWKIFMRPNSISISSRSSVSLIRWSTSLHILKEAFHCVYLFFVDEQIFHLFCCFLV